MRITDWFGKTLSEFLSSNADWRVVHEGMNGETVLLGPEGRAVTVWYGNDGKINAANDGSEKMSANCYGYLNSEKVYGCDNWVYRCRGFGAITSDRRLMDYAKEVSHDWYDAGWHRTFETYYLDSYDFSSKFTKAELARLKELKAEAIAKAKAADDAREWKYVKTIYWADNSEEELWVDKDGNEKLVMTVGPHGDLC